MFVVIEDMGVRYTGDAKGTPISYGLGPTCAAIAFPASLVEIGEEALAGLALTQVIIPGAVRTIGPSAFAGTFSLTAVEMGEGVQAIDARAFGHCLSLTQVTLPASVQWMDEIAFDGSENVQIHAPAGSYAESFANAQGLPFVAQ